MSSGTLEFYESGTSTPANLYSDNGGTVLGTSATLNSEGYPESGGNVITLFRDTASDYKIIGKDSGGSTVWTSDGLNSLLDVLATTNNGEGASLIGLEDSGGNYAATDVEAALAELASTSTGEGASIVGVEDSAGNYTGTDVEAVLAELKDSGTFTGTLTGLTTSPTPTISYAKTGTLVVLSLNAGSTGTSNATTFTVTGVPSALRPATTNNYWTRVTDNGAVSLGTFNINSSGVITFGLGATGGTFTGSGTKGLPGGWTAIYDLG